MIKIKLESIDQEIEIKKLPLKKYVEVLKRIKQIPKQLDGLGDISQDKLISNIPQIITESYDDIAGIIGVVTNLEVDQVGELHLDEVVEIVMAIIEENEFFKIGQNVKKNLAKIQEKK